MNVTTPVPRHKPPPWRINCHARNLLGAMCLWDVLRLASGVQIPECYHRPFTGRDHVTHARVVQSSSQGSPVSGFGVFICTHCHDFDFCQAVVTPNKKRVDGWGDEEKWKRSVFRNSVAKWEPDRYCLKTDLLSDIPSLQYLNFNMRMKGNGSNTCR